MGPTHHKVKSLSGRIFSRVLVFTLVVLAVFGVVATCIYYVTYENDAETALKENAAAAAERLNASGADDATKILDEQFDGITRYTLIDKDGTVLYDSAADVSKMGNHADRPEIQQALKTGEATTARYSETLGTDTVYAAVTLNDGSVLRLAETRHSLLAFLGSLVVPLVVTFVVVALLVLLLSRYLTNRIMEPIDALDFTSPLENEIYTEMDPLLERIDEQQQQLKQQNRELAEAENMRRDFSSNVSHEMKTPLQVISGYAELMKNGLVDPADSKKFAELIYNESQSMRSLIDDVLVLSRLDESAFGDDDTPFDIYKLSCQVVERLQSFADEQNISIRIEGEDASIMGNETLAEYMLYSLIENAIHYNTDGGSVVISVHRERTREAFADIDRGMTPQQANLLRRGAADSEPPYAEREQVIVCISDTGIGIPKELREKVFERFYRVDKSRSKETGGTGLGLAIVKHAVIYHGGTIVLEDNEPQGTIFTLRFPSVSQA